ncbi:MAG TPA: hypothetical protein VIB98_09085 [Gemmatimonadaceae bacterium]
MSATRATLAMDALWGAALTLGTTAIVVLAAQLLCAAARAEGTHNCAHLCSLAFSPPPNACAGSGNHVDKSEVNDAAIGVVYRPERFKSLQHPRGLVYMDVLTVDGRRYFANERALASLIGAAAPHAATQLARNFFTANTSTAPVRQTERNFAEQVMLDSAQAERFLTAKTLADVPLAVTATLPKMFPNDTVPGVLALSALGVDSTSSLAIEIAVLRSPQSLAADHVESVRLVLAERTGLSWRAVREWPIPR